MRVDSRRRLVAVGPAGGWRQAGEALRISRPGARVLGVAALAAGICLSPRIPLPLPVPGRAFELRVEDLVLLVLAPFWLADRRRLDGVLGRVPRAFAAYLAVTLMSTAFGVVVVGIGVTRGATYWGKEVELLLIAVVVATWTQEARDRALTVAWLLVLGLANLAWFAVQLVTHRRSALIIPPSPPGLLQRPRLLEAYGPGLVGEISPLATGAFMMAFFLLAFALYLLIQRRRQAIAYLAAASGFLSATVVSQSRVSIFGAALGAAAMALPLRRYRRGLAGFCAVALVAGAVAALGDSASTGRFTVWHNIEHSFMYRVQISWEPLIARLFPRALPSASPATPSALPTGGATAPTPPVPARTGPPSPVPNPESTNGGPDVAVTSTLRNPDFPGRRYVTLLIGLGSGAMGEPGLLPTEAHNHFLRVFLESGIVGLVAFGWLLVSALLLLVRSARQSAPAGDRAIAYAALAVLLAFLAAALLQDMFLPVVPNELLWLLIGLAAATRLGLPKAAQRPRI